MKSQENLERIVSKLKEHGVEAGEKEKNRLIEMAHEKAKKIIAEAEDEGKKIIDKATSEAHQIEKNANAAIAQSARDMVEATKIAITKHLKNVFGTQCKSLLNQEEYLKELLKILLETVHGDKTVSVAPEQVQKMQSFIAAKALKDGIEVKPLAKSEAKISIQSANSKDIQFVLTSKDIEDGLFTLLNQDLVERIKNSEQK